MAWKPIADAPRNGTVIELGHVDHAYTQYGRWGVHRNTGDYRWVDGHGNGLFDATHWDYPRKPPKK